MKASFYIILFLLSCTLLSCSKEEETPTEPVEDDFSPDAAILLKSGTFEDVVHKVSGKANIYLDGAASTLVLDPFSTENGPDLYVYLSDDEEASNFANLGELKSINGKQSYEIPADINVDDYSYVLIWCQDFSVNFGQAPLN